MIVTARLQQDPLDEEAEGADEDHVGHVHRPCRRRRRRRRRRTSTTTMMAMAMMMLSSDDDHVNDDKG